MKEKLISLLKTYFHYQKYILIAKCILYFGAALRELNTFLTLMFKDWENFVLILLIDPTVPNLMIKKCPRERRGVKMEDLAPSLPTPPPPRAPLSLIKLKFPVLNH